MVRLSLAALAPVFALAALPSAQAATVAYDFSTVPGTSAPTATSNGGMAVTPFTLDGATFSSPSGPGAYTVGAMSALSATLPSAVLSSAGSVATLDIVFSVPQTAISFGFALVHFYGAGDTLTLTPDVGAPTTATTTLATGDFYPSGTLSYTGAAFTSVAITSADPLEIGSLTTNSTAVPEPASFALLATGLLGLAGLRRRA